jgi:hypothetical protein
MIPLEAILLHLPRFTPNILKIPPLYFILQQSHKSLETIVGALYDKLIQNRQLTFYEFETFLFTTIFCEICDFMRFTAVYTNYFKTTT